MSLRGRKNWPVGSSISSSAGVPAIRDDTNLPSMSDALNARSLGERTPNAVDRTSGSPRRMITFFLISP
jgi:hypothetical protein